MGRPIYRDINGVDVRGSYSSTNAGIHVQAYFDNSLHDCFIVNQKGGRTYVVQDLLTDEQAKCKLVNVDPPSVNGTMSLVGYSGGSPVVLHKLHKRTAIDWNDNRYTWSLQNDSSADVIILTPIV